MRVSIILVACPGLCNVVGSNTFNMLGCLGLSGLAASGGLQVAPAVLNFDIWVMLAVALACLPIFLTGRDIERRPGGVRAALGALPRGAGMAKNPAGPDLKPSGVRP